MNEKKIKLAKINESQVAEEIGNFIIDEITSIKRTGAVIGLSGGVDSTTTAALAKRAIDKYNAKNPDKKIELMGYMLPSNTNSPEDEQDGVKVAKRLGIRYEVIDIEPVVKSFSSTNPQTMKENYHKGNLMSEIRAVVLHARAAVEKKLVLGTGNRDEDYGVGYYTLFGDGAVHLSPIGNLPKRLVRQLACYLGFEDLAYRVPTAGLEPGQTDFKDLAYEYEFVELITEALLQGFTEKEVRENKFIIEMGNKNREVYKKKFGFEKFKNVDEMISDFLFRNKKAKTKARIVCPPIASITLIYGDS